MALKTSLRCGRRSCSAYSARERPIRDACVQFAATERDVLSRCSHPNIIPLIESAQCDTTQGTVVYLLVPYYAVPPTHATSFEAAWRDESLTARCEQRGDVGRDVERNGVYSHKEALKVLLQVARALQHLASLDPPLAHQYVDWREEWERRRG